MGVIFFLVVFLAFVAKNLVFRKLTQKRRPSKCSELNCLVNDNGFDANINELVNVYNGL